MSTVPLGQDKRAVRLFIREKLQQLSLAEQQRQSDLIMQKIEQCEAFRAAHSVLCYWPLAGEVNLIPLIEKYATDKVMLLPVVFGKELILKRFEGKAQMQPGSFGIFEPLGVVYDKAVDVALIPGVGFSPEGHRLGRGKGYYDRYLPSVDAFRIGVAFREQVVPDIPCDEWDVIMDIVIAG